MPSPVVLRAAYKGYIIHVISIYHEADFSRIETSTFDINLQWFIKDFPSTDDHSVCLIVSIYISCIK